MVTLALDDTLLLLWYLGYSIQGAAVNSAFYMRSFGLARAWLNYFEIRVAFSLLWVWRTAGHVKYYIQMGWSCIKHD